MGDKPSEFTQNLRRLEEIVGQLEKEEVDLEEGLNFYKEAAKLIRKLKKRLSFIENEIEEVQQEMGEK
jgi:exodeoxyribonuclease VII small subunit